MKHPQPNRLLRAARERSGMSRTALAEAVSLWLAQRDPKGRDVAFDANHLGKIERGIIERPRANYIAALCAVLRATEADLGFDHSSRATPDDVDRKAFLQAAFGVGAGALIARNFPDHDATDLVATVSGPTAHYRRMSDAVSSIELTPAVEAHLRLATSVITNMLPTRDGFAALSEASLLAAYVARDREDAGSARQHYAHAVHYAQRAQHPLLTGFMLLSRGSYATDSGDPARALHLFQQANRELAGTGAPDATHALLAAFQATAHADAGDRAASLTALRTSESLGERGRGEPRWPWIFAFDAPKAARYQAATLARLDDVTAAQAAFAAAEPGLTQPKPLALAQVDHARALAHTGHVDEACALAVDALTIGYRYGSERIVLRVRSLRAEFPPRTREAAALDEALAALDRV